MGYLLTSGWGIYGWLKWVGHLDLGQLQLRWVGQLRQSKFLFFGRYAQKKKKSLVFRGVPFPVIA